VTDAEVEKLFAYEHLPEHLKVVSIKFYECAMSICGIMPPSAYRTKALNELWQAKNWAVAGVAQA
jgi:hypothetical protein